MDFDLQRKRMVETQLITRGICDSKVLEAFSKVPRHKFIDEKFLVIAYADHPLPISAGQTISQPFMVALMTELLKLKGTERVLEIGAGSGYQAAILSELASQVFTVERIEALTQFAKTNLEKLGYKNVKVKTGDGTLGWPEFAPYDAIIVTAGAPKVPQALVDQLREGGRLVIPVGNNFTQMLTLVEKKKTGVEASQTCGCMFVPLIGKDGWKG